ncbi:hypothetical protein, partial [Serratia sp. DD3]|uniref:IS66 family insertion sequence element accessory protein TnpA n=1 Tax=Serratia sp. DD3 TaxID=1410619 RepID=UPI0004D75D4B
MKSQQRADYWREQITLWQASGLSGQIFCQQHQLTYHQFVYWRQKYRMPEDPLSPGFAKVTATVPVNSAELTLSVSVKVVVVLS